MNAEPYWITISQDYLARLIGISCAHVLVSEDSGALRLENDELADKLLSDGNQILQGVGVIDVNEFNEACRRELEAALHLAEPEPTNPGSSEDPYLWESGT